MGKIETKAKVERKRGQGLQRNIKNKIIRQRLKIKEEKIAKTAEAAARAELLLTEGAGYLGVDEGETTTQFRQQQIASATDITSASKHFNIHLDFGPYRLNYSRNGRHLLIGGRKGHVAAFDWVTKKLGCEMNVMESVHDVAWLHVETMFAVAQKNWVSIYDNVGIELHCMKRMNRVTRLEFLPYHFLLASASDEGFLAWLDISIGQIISRYNSKLGRISVMTQNPSNAVLCVGNSKGVVSMWSPKSQDPLAKMLCHKQAISSCAIHPYGTYMATSSPDRSVKVWDIRQLAGPVHHSVLRSAAYNLAYSQKGLLAASLGNIVEVFTESNNTLKPYIRHRDSWRIEGLQFCPYEDVLGIGTVKGFSSLLIPGSGEANFDALEVNPFETKSQRREAEVKSLLDKIQPEFITLDSGSIAQVHIPSLKEKVEAQKKLLFIKPKEIDLKPRKGKIKGGSIKIVKTKKALKEIQRREAAEATVTEKPQNKMTKSIPTKKYGDALDRFVQKNK